MSDSNQRPAHCSVRRNRTFNCIIHQFITEFNLFGLFRYTSALHYHCANEAFIYIYLLRPPFLRFEVYFLEPLVWFEHTIISILQVWRSRPLSHNGIKTDIYTEFRSSQNPFTLPLVLLHLGLLHNTYFPIATCCISMPLPQCLKKICRACRIRTYDFLGVNHTLWTTELTP